MSGLLDLVIALMLIYLVFAIVVSGLQEWWSQYFGQRGAFLRLGMQRLIGDEAIFVRVLQHPLVGSLYRDRAARGKPPAYIDPCNFALAFADVALRRAAPLVGAHADPMQIPATTLDFASLRDAVSRLRLQHSAAALAVLPIIERAEGDLPKALKGIEDWFSNGMDRVSGWYKAYAQRRLFAWGLVVACLCNVDTIAIFQALNRTPALATSLAGIAQSTVRSGTLGGVDVGVLKERELTADESRAVLRAVLEKPVTGLPIGYACLGALAATDRQGNADPTASTDALKDTWQRCRVEWHDRVRRTTVLGFLMQLLGWTLTALAGVLGAPYWFGLLSKVINIRGAGPKPKVDKAAS